MKKTGVALSVAMLFAGGFAPPAFGALEADKVDITGGWQSAEDGGRMVILAEAGILRIVGSDRQSFFELSCVPKSETLHCRGGGTTLNGKGFMYESTFVMQPDGKMQETWTAHDAAERKDGKATWQRTDAEVTR